MANSSQTILNIIARAVNIYNSQSKPFSLKGELEYVRKLTDDEDLVADFFEYYYEGHDCVTYNRETQELHDNSSDDYLDDYMKKLFDYNSDDEER
jgi:hypothetical protein